MRELFLCSNVLFISNTKYEDRFKIKYSVPLETLWVSDCLEKTGRANSRARRSLVLGWPNCSIVISFYSLRDKEEWLFCLHSFIKLAKNKAQPENTSLDTIIEDSEDYTFDSEEDDRVSMDSVKNETPDATGKGHSQGNEAGHLPMGPDDSTSASTLKKSFSLDLMSEDTPGLSRI
ncbi:rho GTPase-activating protein 20-like [Erinaceus europaeus]|uniref:Rho GTPase-activating protein 20-like n=1 Tax=Erinaceus europaeus TaxID=9365 RepID=A0ABM3WF79_ERIEU|nr:rho GTPase-activating protein 20-like [Erinaceus europaeus]